MSREAVLSAIRGALRRPAAGPVDSPPPVRLSIPATTVEDRVALFTAAVEALAGKVFAARSPAEACGYIASVLAGRTAVASNAPLLRDAGVTALAGVRTGITDAPELRDLCASSAAGITGAHYGLADTGTLVLFASHDEPRLISLLPPVHIALLRRESILSGLDELLTKVPLPADRSSSMVLVTGPSRTADIEQILVRGVHGPGELHAVLL